MTYSVTFILSIAIGAVRHTAPTKIRYVQFAFSQIEKPATHLKLT